MASFVADRLIRTSRAPLPFNNSNNNYNYNNNNNNNNNDNNYNNFKTGHRLFTSNWHYISLNIWSCMIIVNLTRHVMKIQNTFY